MDVLKYLVQSNMDISLTEVFAGLACAVLLGMFIYWVYKKTYSGVLYSKNFNVTIVLVTMVTAMIMMVIGSNLALSLGMVGALSIVRFRTALKDPKDIAYLFWGITAGLSCGAGIYIIGIVGSLFIACILFLFSKNVYSETIYLLVIRGENINLDNIEKILNAHCKKYRLKMQNVIGDKMEVTFEVRLISDKDCGLLRELKTFDENLNVNLVSFDGEISG